MSTQATAVRVHGHHIAGERVDGPLLDRRAPASNQVVACYAAGTAENVDAAARAAAEAFASADWRRTPAMARAGLLENLAALLERDAGRLAALDSEEVGKPLRFARGDVDLGIAHVRQAAALARTSKGESYTGLAPAYTALATREPVGVAALIIPWNFPALILLQKLPYALAAGCTVVAKPSEFTSGSALEIAALCEEAGIPPGVVNVVTGTGPDAGLPMVTHPLISYVSFTGSTRVGREVMRAAAGSLTRVGLELGGKTGNVVFADADLETAADGIVFAAFANQGESCVASSRLLVDETVAEEFTAAVVDRASALRVGMPDDPRADIGALIHHEHRDRVHAAVLAGADAGGKVLTGGSPPGDPDLEAGAFYPPTVIASVGRESPVFQKEIFGPVLSVTTFRSEREAVELANATDYGLAQSVWTTNLDRAFAVSRDLEAGTVWVNTATDGSPALAFGGVKASGFGREAGEEGLREFTEYKTVQFRGEPRVSPFARTEPTR
ncbi:aldehyde dehydrogenase family protein [Actinomadura livida]|uniref:Acyl-CoA reductase-like NAD-dependent aldehyde dehydrogenase n=1 Tax=Actinomadura livida TaxID=79909 RepID=A0A7W7MVZ5_9ACTN|nr:MULTISPECIES: aldehyde dehydrogenase family protein [Actinomadura]MBB4772324.1 acyl-CoA reductase-like NAD-dependent aldehyde dehydrogenase [Actinomadura catellatispora]GGU28551.1 aldehyde dehydrogenase [Actinomadura livida]